jgi:hypothetical protein
MDKAPFDELIVLASKKRDQLMVGAQRKRTWRRALIFGSGVLALISGGSITAVISNWTDSSTVKILSAGLAFLSGFTSLLLGAFFDDKEIQKMYDGAGKFLALRNRVKSAGSKPQMTEKAAHESLTKLQEEYAKLSQEYDQFIGPIYNRVALFSGSHLSVMSAAVEG